MKPGPGDLDRLDVGRLAAGPRPALRRARADCRRPPWLRARRPSRRWSTDRRAPPRAAARRRSGERSRPAGSPPRRRQSSCSAAPTRAWKSSKIFMKCARERSRRGFIASSPWGQKAGGIRRARSGRSCRRCSRRRRAPAPLASRRPWPPSPAASPRDRRHRRKTAPRTTASARSRTRVDLRVAIHVGEQKRLDVAVGRRHRRREADQRPPGPPHVLAGWSTPAAAMRAPALGDRRPR